METTQTQHRVLFDAAWRSCSVWATPDGDLYADIKVGDQLRTVSIGASGFFGAWLRQVYTNITDGSIARSDMLSEVVKEFQARALISGKVIKPALRVGGDDNTVYIDSCATTPRYYKITSDGWSVTDNSPYRFIKSNGALELPYPVKGPSLPATLGRFLPVRSEDDMALTVAWLVGALKPQGPYPILTISGEQGATKSTFLRVLKRIIDPSSRELYSPPSGERDFVSSVKNSFVVGFDNVSVIRHWLSDAMCRVATGTSALGGRKLYTNDDDASFMACRPQMVNGIPDFVERGDFIDRSIHINLVKPKDYKADDVFWREFEEALPSILGALYDAVACALKNQETVELTYKPRMINFARWVQAAEPATTFKPGRMMEAYKRNRIDATEKMLEFTGIAQGIKRVLEQQPKYEGTYQGLYDLLSTHMESKDMPKNAYGLASELRRIAPALRDNGIIFEIKGRLTGGCKDSEKGRTAISIGNVPAS